ncbi:MAG TPA: helix-turn-helix transcriptional regulator [Kofleriaceae bacterium]|jgi:AraC-like DNA-binding protein
MVWLSRFIDDVRVVDMTGPRRLARLPDGRTNLVFRVHEGGRTGDLTVTGPRTRAYFKTASNIARWVTIELKRGWSTQLLGVPASTLTNRIVHLHDIWGTAGADLRDQLVAARSLPDALERLSYAFAARTDHAAEPASARLARRAARMLETENLRISSVAERLGVTARHLRRAFNENIGVGPKDFARAIRLRRVVESSARMADWGQIAADAGYYDQAHLIADFRELVGVTPTAFAKHATGGG